MAWFEGLPRPIPGLACKLIEEGREIHLRVGRIDREGIFVFSQRKDPIPLSSPAVSSSWKAIMKKKHLNLVLSFGKAQIACQGVPILSLGQWRGMGIQFEKVSADLRKEIGDFVEVLSEAGYI